MPTQNPTVKPTDTSQQLPAVEPVDAPPLSGVTAMCPIGGYLWAVTGDGKLYRIRPNPFEVLQVLPQPALRDVEQPDQAFEFQRASTPTFSV
jgi:hypothetical protein